MTNSTSPDPEPPDEQLSKMLDHIEQQADGEQETLGEVLDAISNRGFGPLLLIPALLAISPLGAIPGMSIITGSLIIVIATQMLFRNDHPWIPERLENVAISRDSLVSRIRQGRPWVRWVEYFFSRRLEVLTTGPMHYILAVVIIVLALSMYPLALVPMGVFIPGLAIAILAAGLTVHDGLLTLLGLGTATGAIVSLIYWWPWS